MSLVSSVIGASLRILTDIDGIGQSINIASLENYSCTHVCICKYVHRHACHGTCAEARGQLEGVGSPSLCGSLEGAVQ